VTLVLNSTQSEQDVRTFLRKVLHSIASALVLRPPINEGIAHSLRNQHRGKDDADQTPRILGLGKPHGAIELTNYFSTNSPFACDAPGWFLGFGLQSDETAAKSLVLVNRPPPMAQEIGHKAIACELSIHQNTGFGIKNSRADATFI
jgi:hypothetical protein